MSTHVHPVRPSESDRPAAAHAARVCPTLVGPQVHVGAALHGPRPLATDPYQPCRERHRRGPALIAALTSIGVPPAAVAHRLGPRHRRALHRGVTLHLHVQGLDALAGLTAAGLASRGRVVVHLHDSAGWPLRTGSRATLRHRLVGGPIEHRLLDRADLIVVRSERLRDELDRQHGRPVLVVPPAPLLEPAHLPAPLERPRPDLPGRRIVAVGPLVPRRATGLLVEALRAQPDDTRLLLLGTGPDREAIDRRARSAGIADRVHVLPSLTCGTVAAHLQHADVVASATLVGDDTVPILQAMQRGRPVVATRVDEMPHVITDGLDGYLVPPVATDHLADAIHRLLTDPAHARTVGASARRRTAGGWDRAARQITEVLAR